MRNISRYQLFKDIGHGSTATVYKAIDSESQEPYALKVFSKIFWNEELFRDRRSLEFSEISKLKHPNIVDLVDLVVDEDQAAFVMKYVDGESLEFAQNRLPYVLPEISVALICEVLKAVEESHKHGILHRDIKPANILISKEGSVFVTDFGHARFASNPQATLAGGIVGSPEFMSPEQAQGFTLNESTDLFSVASVLYFLVTGTKAFSKPTVVQTIRAVSECTYDSPQRCNPKISGALARIIEKGLSKKPADRFPTASAFRLALTSYLVSVELIKNETQTTADLFKNWFLNSSFQTLAHLHTIKDALSLKIESLIAKHFFPEAWEAIAHLSLVAPQSPDLARFTNILENISTQSRQTNGRKKTLYFGMSVGVLSLIGLGSFFANLPKKSPSIQPPVLVKTIEPEKAVEEIAPPPDVIKKVTSTPKKVPKQKLQSVVFDVPSDVKVTWNRKYKGKGTQKFKEAPGIYTLVLERKNEKPIIQSIKVTESEPVLIRVR